MVQTAIQRTFAPIKAILPRWLSNPIRSVFTAFLTPVLFSYRTGHFRSSLRMAAVSRKGIPVPWYTYPAIDFLKHRPHGDRIILEFGGGQSTLWWAERASRVVTFEGDPGWYNKIKDRMPPNVDLHLVSMASPDVCVEQVRKVLDDKPYPAYDVIIIDGLYRYELIAIARERLAEGGAIVCDNAEGYGFFEGLRESGLNRVDFFGHAPGVVLPHCTSIFFRPASYLFEPGHPIPVIAHD